jgi:hypothetical protein
MVESKSGYFINDFNEFSDEAADSAPRSVNRLVAQSEWTRNNHQHVGIVSGCGQTLGGLGIVHDNELFCFALGPESDRAGEHSSSRA